MGTKYFLEKRADGKYNAYAKDNNEFAPRYCVCMNVSESEARKQITESKKRERDSKIVSTTEI